MKNRTQSARRRIRVSLRSSLAVWLKDQARRWNVSESALVETRLREARDASITERKMYESDLTKHP